MYEKHSFYPRIESLFKLIHSMVAYEYNLRPECALMLSQYTDWSIDTTVLMENQTEYELTLNALKTNDNSFFYEFLNNKMQ